MKEIFMGRKGTLIKLAICAGLILVSALIGSYIQTAGWSCSIEDLQNASNTGTITLQAVDKDAPASYTVKGSVTSGILIIPKNATAETPAPAIVFTHGLYNNREMQLQNGIEMARRGFVVILLDREQHGHNTTMTYNNYGDSMLSAAKYLYNLTDKNGNKIVDGSKIAVSGHSMGGSATNNALALDGVSTNGSITYASGKSEKWNGATDEALKNGYHMGIISAGLVQANNASNTSYGTNLLGVGNVKASSDEFFYTATLKSPTYVAIHKDSMTSVMFYQGANENYSGSVDGKIYVKKGNSFVAITSNDKFKEGTQYYKYTKSGNATNYLMSSQAMAFVGQNTANVTADQYNVVNGGLYDFNTGALIAQPNEKGKLASVATKGQQLSSATTQLRVVYEAQETHPMNHFSTDTASHVIDFFYNVFGVPEGAKYKAPTRQTWLIKEIVACFGFIGMFGFIIVLAEILLKTKFFSSLSAKEQDIPELPSLMKKPQTLIPYWVTGILTAWFSAYSIKNVSTWYGKSLFKKLIANTTSIIPGVTLQSCANIGQIAYWGIVCALFGIAMTAVVWFINRIVNMIIYKDDYCQYDTHPFAAFKIRSWSNVGKTLVLAATIVISFYGIVFVLWKWLVVDFRIWTFDLRTFRMDRILDYLHYVPYFFIFYMTSAALSVNYRTKEIPEWASIAINVCFNVVGLIILFGTHNAHFIATGGLNSNANKLFYIACFPIIPCVGFATVVGRRLYTKTGNAWLPGLINAIIFTFLACANTSIG